jgi:pyridoxine kinase
MSFSPPKSVLSIQSHVAFGHVGNAAAVFPLQRLGIEVWPVHTCQLSNHTGYPSAAGTVFAADHVRAVLGGMAERGALAGLDGLLSGWLGRPEVGEAVLWALEQAPEDVLYLCDPVMGDDTEDGAGRLYAAPGIPAFFRDRLVPRASVVTPNRFELELLSGCPVADVAQAVAAARRLVARGPRLVVVSSVPSPPETACCLAVTAEAAWLAATPRLTLDPAPNGAGDLLAGLLLGHLLHGRPVAEAVSLAVSGLHGVLRLTAAAASRDLLLVAGQDLLAAPVPLFPAEPMAPAIEDHRV